MLEPLRIIVNNYTFLMIPIEGGIFDMGDEVGDLWEACRPVHKLKVSPFYLAQYPVNQTLWQAVMGNEPSHFTGGQRPVEQVSWEDAYEFINRLRKITRRIFRLPTEAEWEFAARGGVYNTGLNFAGSNRLKEVGWFQKNSHGETKLVGLKFCNELGLYDMSGNIWEWCEDQWHSDYKGAPEDESAWVDGKTISIRVCRGGSWTYVPHRCRSTYRGNWNPTGKRLLLGFRLALSLQLTGRPDGGL